MDRKPWKNEGSHRAPFGGDDRGDRRERRFDRSDRADRSDRREFSDRREGGDRREFGGRREFGDRREGGDRRDFGARRSFGDRKSFGRAPQRDRFGGDRGARFGVRSGPRARALETRRFADRTDFAKQGVVRLDADVADYFDSAEAVNQALRLLIQSSLLLAKKKDEKAVAADVDVTSDEAVEGTDEELGMTDPFDDEDELDDAEEDAVSEEAEEVAEAVAAEEKSEQKAE